MKVRKLFTVFLVLCCFLIMGMHSALAATEQAKQLAIDKGLAYLASTQNLSGYWLYNNNGTLAATAAAALAFIEEGFLPGSDVFIDIGSGPVNHGDVVGLACTYIFNQARVETRFGTGWETAVYPRHAEDYNNNGVLDDGGNNQAIYFYPGNMQRNVYTTGIVAPVIFALGEKLGENTTVGRGTVTSSMTYKQVLQDVMDWFSFAQVEPDRGVYRGGWQYDANAWSSDNSTAQWGALPTIYGKAWGLTVPQYVKDELALWVAYIQNANGGSGYQHPTVYVNVAKTGGLLCEFAVIGKPKSDPKVQAALNFINGRWNNGPSGTWYGNLNHPYAMWGVYKGLEVYGMLAPYGSGSDNFLIGNGMSAAPGGITIGQDYAPKTSLAGDWYSHYSDYLVSIQEASGRWNGYTSYWYGPLSTAWYINILNASTVPAAYDALVLTKQDNLQGGDASVGDNLTYEITYLNENNNPVTGAEIIDTLPPEVEYVSSTPAGTYNQTQHTVTWDIGTLGAGSDGEIQLVVLVKPCTTLSSTIRNVCSSTIEENRQFPSEVFWDTTICDTALLSIYQAALCGKICLYSAAWNPSDRQYVFRSGDPDAQVPASPITPWTGFFANVFDTNGLDLMIPDNGVVPPASNQNSTFAIGTDRWYLISTPLVTSTDIGTNLGDDLPGSAEVDWRISKRYYVDGTYTRYPASSPASMDLLPGRGFWAVQISGDTQTFDITGTAAPTIDTDGTKYYELKLPSNGSSSTLHMAGNPFMYDILWQDCMVRVPMTAAQIAKIAVANEPVDKFHVGVKLEALNGEARDTYNRAGIILNQSINPEIFCMSDLEPIGDYVRVTLNDTENSERSLYAYDYRAPGALEYSWEIELSTSYNEIDVQFILDNFESVPAEYTFELLNKSTGEIITISDDAAFNLTLSSVYATSYVLTASMKSTSAESSSIPAEFGISGAYPNPFNPSTTLQYKLPSSGNVKVSVYNLNGQLIDVLVNGLIEAGTHSVVWDAGSNATGIYLFVVESQGMKDSRKITFVK